MCEDRFRACGVRDAVVSLVGEDPDSALTAHSRDGGEFRARFVTTGWEGTGRVEECDPPRHWRVRTQGAEEPGEHTMQVTLRAEDDRTVLVLEERGMPLDQLAAYGAGLQVHAEDLNSHVRGVERRDARERWAELLPSYQGLAAEVVRG